MMTISIKMMMTTMLILALVDIIPDTTRVAETAPTITRIIQQRTGLHHNNREKARKAIKQQEVVLGHDVGYLCIKVGSIAVNTTACYYIDITLKVTHQESRLEGKLKELNGARDTTSKRY
jgi:hypothetical protein